MKNVYFMYKDGHIILISSNSVFVKGKNSTSILTVSLLKAAMLLAVLPFK